MKKHSFNKNTFIQGWYIPKKICDNIIKFFNKSKHRHIVGTTSSGVNLEVKDSTDINIKGDDSSFDEYNKHLKQCVIEYADTYKLDNVGTFSSNVETYNIQYYKKGGGFKEWHFERGGGKGMYQTRILVFMTYLNDVPDGGTEFMYQNIISPAKKGLTLIWPAEFTHLHRGQISKTKEKYIVTGWFNYL